MGLCFIIKKVRLCLLNYYILILLMIKYFYRNYQFSGENFRFGYTTVEVLKVPLILLKQNYAIIQKIQTYR